MVLKILSKDILHKSDAGGVKIDLRSEYNLTLQDSVGHQSSVGRFVYATPFKSVHIYSTPVLLLTEESR